jgi:hypothetical protein
VSSRETTTNPVLDKVLAGLGGDSMISDAGLADAPLIYDNSKGPWLYVTLKDTAEDTAGAVLAQWQAYLVANAYARESGSGDALGIAGATYQRATPGGVVYLGSETSDGMNAADPTVDLDRQSISDDLTRGVEQTGLKLVSIAYEKPAGSAALVVAQTSDAASFVKETPRAGGVLLPVDERALLDGLYVEVLDESGQPFEADGYATRSQTYITWIRKDLFDPSSMCGIGCPDK